MRRMNWLVAVFLLTMLAACQASPSAPASPTATAPSSPTPASAATITPAPTSTATPARAASPKVEVVASGLEVPWALAFAPDGRLFFTERPGRIRVIADGSLLPEAVATLPVAHAGEGGLLGLALDPDFQRNHYMYAYYTYREGGRLFNRVVRLTERDGKASEEKVLLEEIPGASIHDGGRIAFGLDGMLYATTGDATAQSAAQDLDSLAGKILRIAPDGSIPTDNPFPGSPVYSYGHRNPQGLAWQPGTGRLFSTEHGPVGDDEVNIIVAGENYGWPTARGIARREGFIDPIADYSPSLAPGGAAFYTGDDFPAWQGDLFFGTLVGRHLHRVALSPSGDAVSSQERLFEGDFGRIREVAIGPDGFLYFTTSNRDGRGSPAPDDDRILRIVPAP